MLVGWATSCAPLIFDQVGEGKEGKVENHPFFFSAVFRISCWKSKTSVRAAQIFCSPLIGNCNHTHPIKMKSYQDGFIDYFFILMPS